MQLRSLFFGGIAMLAAAMFMHAPARAIDYEPGLTVYSLEWPDFAPIVEFTAVDEMRLTAVPQAHADAHAGIYTSQNQPLTTWRSAVEAYSLIDPHIHRA